MKNLGTVVALLAAGPTKGSPLFQQPDIPPVRTWEQEDPPELAPTCSYGPQDDMQPDRVMSSPWPLAPVKFPRTKHEPAPLYAGLMMWESRGGMTLRRAVLAMLGDRSIFYETPLFTAYRLLALGRAHEISQLVYHSLGCGGYNEDWIWDGYGDFYRMVTFRSYDDSQNGGFPLAANEAEAAAMAKALTDDFFDMPPEQFRKTYLLDVEGWDEGRGLRDPYYALYASMSKRMAWYSYAFDMAKTKRFKRPIPPQMLVLEPTACRRGMDLNFMELKEIYEGHMWRVIYKVDPAQGRDFSKEVTDSKMWPIKWDYAKDLCDCQVSSDFTQVMAPGYHLPQDIAAIEYGDYAFYRVWWRGRAHVAVLKSDKRCIMRTPPPPDEEVDVDASVHLRGSDGVGGAGGGGSPGAADTGAPVTFSYCWDFKCLPEFMNYCGATPLQVEEPAMRVPALAVLYALPAATAAEGAVGTGGQAATVAARATAAADAAALLAELNGEALSPLSSPPNVPAKRGDGLPLLPAWLPQQLLLQLLSLRLPATPPKPPGDADGEQDEDVDLEDILGGGPTVTAAAVTVSDARGTCDGAPADGAVMHQWSLGLADADEARRPSAAQVLRERGVAEFGAAGASAAGGRGERGDKGVR